MKRIMIAVICLMGITAMAGCTNIGSPGTTATPAPAATMPPFYLGVPRASLEARLGTPTVPGDPYGYSPCPNYPAYSLWVVSYDKKTDRAILIGPRGSCTDAPPAWRDWATLVLPPDAQFVSAQSEDGGTTLETYTSGWLALRVGCGTINVRGSGNPEQFSAFIAC